MSGTATSRARKRRAVQRTPGTVDRLPSGRHRARYLDPVTGKQVSLGTFRTDDDAWLALREHAVTIDRETPDDRARRHNVTTIGELFDEFLTVKAKTIQPDTLRKYRVQGQRDIVAKIGTRRVVTFTRRDASLWWAKACPGSPTSATAAYRLLKGLFDYAVEIDLRDDNPIAVKGAGTTRAVKAAPTLLTDDEFTALVKAMPTDQDRVFVTLARHTGLRRGELAALRRRDIDLTERTVHVTRAWSEAQGQMKTMPKSKTGVRTVPLGDAYPIVRAWLMTRGGGADTLLWRNRLGGGATISLGVFHRHWLAAVAAIGRPDVNFHQLRHAFGTELMASGIPLVDVMRLMGHADVSTTMRYQRPSMSSSEVAKRVAAYRAARQA